MILPADDAPSLPPDVPDEGDVSVEASRLRSKILDHALRSASWSLQAALDVLPQATKADLNRWAYTWGVLEGLSGRASAPADLHLDILEPFNRGLAAGRYVRTGRPA